MTVIYPYDTSEENVRRWREDVTDVLNALPSFSIFSTTDGPEDSAVTANLGTIGIDIGSATTTFWGKTSEGTTGWLALE